jgi:uncharacterized paraquat-inducible protein A
MIVANPYTGAHCPRCNVPLTSDWIRSGIVTCPYCSRAFEATAFHPPERKQQLVEMAAVTPDGTVNACANHAGNAATASCQRCGLFICALCDMNVGSGSYCPSCFDRVRSEGKLPAARRYRDYASMARTTAIFGLLFWSIGLGPVTIYYAVKGRRQRRADGQRVIGVTITMLVGVLETLALLAVLGALTYGIVKS